MNNFDPKHAKFLNLSLLNRLNIKQRFPSPSKQEVVSNVVPVSVGLWLHRKGLASVSQDYFALKSLLLNSPACTTSMSWSLRFLKWQQHGIRVLTLLLSLSLRNLRITYSITIKKNQSHLLTSQPEACSGRFCLIRKCPPQGTFPGGSLTFSLREENIKA